MTFIGKQTVQYVLFANRTCLYLHCCPDLRMILGIGCLSASYQVWLCTVVSKEEIYISCQHSRGIPLNQDILPETRSQLGIPKKVLCSGRSQQLDIHDGLILVDTMFSGTIHIPSCLGKSATSHLLCAWMRGVLQYQYNIPVLTVYIYIYVYI